MAGSHTAAEMEDLSLHDFENAAIDISTRAASFYKLLVIFESAILATLGRADVYCNGNYCIIVLQLLRARQQ